VLHRFRNSSGWGSQLRGPCPLHKSRNERGRTFSVNLQRNIFRCFNPTCAAQGNVLDLWAAYHDLPLHEAALHLAETFGVMPPRLKDHGSQLPNQRSVCVDLQGVLMLEGSTGSSSLCRQACDACFSLAKHLVENDQ
jgi:DNA primase